MLKTPFLALLALILGSSGALANEPLWRQGIPNTPQAIDLSTKLDGKNPAAKAEPAKPAISTAAPVVINLTPEQAIAATKQPLTIMVPITITLSAVPVVADEPPGLNRYCGTITLEADKMLKAQHDLKGLGQRFANCLGNKVATQ